MNDPNGYTERVQRVVDYLGEHLDEVLDLETLARVACFSPYHFHRIYRQAVRSMLSSRSSKSMAARCRCKRRTVSLTVSPSNARYRGARRVAQLDQERSPTMYQVKTITLPRIRVAAIQLRGDYQLTGRAFERLMAVAATTGLLTPDMRSMGVFYDDPASVPEAELRAAACITVPDDWAAPQKLAPQRKAAASCGASGELTEAQIEGGRYAWLYQTWLPNSAEEPRDLPCIEEYLNNPRQVPAKDLETAVMMPLVG